MVNHMLSSGQTTCVMPDDEIWWADWKSQVWDWVKKLKSLKVLGSGLESFGETTNSFLRKAQAITWQSQAAEPSVANVAN